MSYLLFLFISGSVIGYVCEDSRCMNSGIYEVSMK